MSVFRRFDCRWHTNIAPGTSAGANRLFVAPFVDPLSCGRAGINPGISRGVAGHRVRSASRYDTTRPRRLKRERGPLPTALESTVMRATNIDDILRGRAPQDTPVTVKGWIRTRRDSKAGFSFLHVSDGTTFHPLQVVAAAALPNYASEIMRLTAGCAVEAVGPIVPSSGKGQRFEMQASAVKVVGWVEDPDSYPIQPKPHSLEFLREVAHLRPRTNVIGAATRMRHTVAQAIHRFFHEQGFFWVNTPIITAADAEGAGAL